MSSAEASRPLASRTVRFPVRSWLISRMARIGFSSVMSRSTTDGSSSMRRRIDVAPTLRNVAYSLMFESPTITWRRRKRSASAWGSSRVLMRGGPRVGGRAGAVGVRVVVVLEQVDAAPDALLAEALLGRRHQPLEDPLPRLVVDDEVG